MISEQPKMSSIFQIDDDKLIEKFVQGSNQLLASNRLRLEVNGGLSQLMAHNGDSIAIMYLQNKPRTAIVKHSSPLLELLDTSLQAQGFVAVGNASRAGFLEYKYYVTPAGYKAWYTDPSILWKKWWPTERFHNKQRFNMDILVNFKDNWYPVQDISVHAGTFTIKTIAGQLKLQREGKVLWLAQVMQEHLESTTSFETNAKHDLPEHPSLPPSPPITELRSQLHSQSGASLAAKIQQKQSEISPEQAWIMIKELEQKLQAQIRLTTETEDKFTRSEQRSAIAEQRLQIVYKYLQKKGINPQDIYHAN
jgi:hypothetical protein